MEDKSVTKQRTVYCHFSFKRPNKGNDGYGIFSVAFYNDFEGKKLIHHKTVKKTLWENHQFITAIQSYEYALCVIAELQGIMMSQNITQVMLVTDNSTLAGWIENPKKNKQYTEYMRRATRLYKMGGNREILISTGLCEVRKYEKSYKYCSERYVIETMEETLKVNKKEGKNIIELSNNYKTIDDMVKESSKMPEVVGMTEL